MVLAGHAPLSAARILPGRRGRRGLAGMARQVYPMAVSDPLVVAVVPILHGHGSWPGVSGLATLAGAAGVPGLPDFAIFAELAELAEL